jgi:CubicO group peptidase (beta-lactamase class C family)
MSLTAEHLQARLDELAAKHRVVGATVGVGQGDQLTTAVTGTAHLATGLPVTTDTVFQIGSITKIYTATLVLQLVDEGLVELDTPVKAYLPELRLGDATAEQTITVRQLLTHTSGIDGDHFADFGRGDDAIARYVASCAQLPQVFEPGRMMSYCNAGWVILGRLVEVVRDQPFAQAMTEHLLTPAGLQNSPQSAEEAILRHAAVGHLPAPDDDATRFTVAPVYSISHASAPAGSLQCATIGDLLGFARLHLADGTAPDGTQVLSADLARSMRRQEVQLADPYTLGDAWGLGWILMTWDGQRVIGHDGSTIGQSSFLRLLPEQDLAIGLLTNGGDSRALFEALFRELFDDLAGVRMPELPEPMDDTRGVDLRRYVGTYERLSVRLDITLEDDKLVLRTTVSGPLAALVPPVPDKVLLVAPAVNLLYAPPDDPAGRLTPLVFFDFDDRGRPQWLHFGARAARRVGQGAAA